MLLPGSPWQPLQIRKTRTVGARQTPVAASSQSPQSPHAKKPHALGIDEKYARASGFVPLSQGCPSRCSKQWEDEHNIKDLENEDDSDAEIELDASFLDNGVEEEEEEPSETVAKWSRIFSSRREDVETFEFEQDYSPDSINWTRESEMLPDIKEKLTGTALYAPYFGGKITGLDSGVVNMVVAALSDPTTPNILHSVRIRHRILYRSYLQKHGLDEIETSIPPGVLGRKKDYLWNPRQYKARFSELYENS
ncbi:hypothetical protein EDD11_003231 [Mortierella claussenii]|nr:hypothetical protein EDD11_003231 [Mortierella claussenii]